MLRTGPAPPIEADFTSTRWTLIARLKSSDPQARREALAVLCETYWPPVYTFLRRLGHSREAARDYVQGFFVDVVLERRLFEQAVPDRGRLRSLLRVAAKNFVLSEIRKERAKRPLWSCSVEALDAEESRLHRLSHMSPEDSYERRWATLILQEALGRAERHFLRRKAQHWRAFELRIVNPSVWRTEPPPYAIVARTCGFRDEAAAIDAVAFVRKRVLAILNLVVAETVEDPTEQRQELALVLAALDG